MTAQITLSFMGDGTSRVPQEPQEISRFNRFPVQGEEAFLIREISNEVVQLILVSTNASDTTANGAGSLVYGRLAKKRLLDSMRDRLASEGDTSLTVASAPFSNFVPFDAVQWAKLETESRADKIEALTEEWNEGDYTIIPESGIIIAKKSSTQATATVSYAVSVQSVGVSKIIPPTLVKSDKDTHFIGSIAQNAKAEADITGLPASSGFVEGIHLTSDQNLDWDLYFFATDGNTDTDMDVERFLGVVTFVAADAKQIAGSGQYYYSTNNCSYPFHEFPYIDEDGTKEIHVALVNRNATSKNAGATGEVVLGVVFRPDND